MTVDIIANLSPSVAGHIDHDAPTPHQNRTGRQKCFWRPTPFTPTENTTEKEQKNGHERRGPKRGGGRNPGKSTQNHLTITTKTGNVIGGWEEPLPTNRRTPPGCNQGGSTTKQGGGEKDGDLLHGPRNGANPSGIHRSSHPAVADAQARARPPPQVRPTAWPHGKPWGHAPPPPPSTTNREPGVWARAGGPAPTPQGKRAPGRKPR